MNIEEKVVARLLERNMVFTAAESCTGGLISAAVVNVPGSSACFNEGYITYANEAKVKLLGVKRKTLEDFGAVSREVAAQMSEGALKRAEADIAVSVSGIAGPSGGSEEKPVGTVFAGISIKDKNSGEISTETVRFLFKGNRNEIRRQTVEEVLKKVLSAI